MVHLERLKKLAALLNRTGDLWRQRPFVQLPVPWETDWPHLSKALRSLDAEQTAACENDPLQHPAVRKAVPDIAETLETLCTWPPLPRIALVSEDFPGPKRVRRRKWDQVTTFVSTVAAQPVPADGRWVDWCSGKGHLGRALYKVKGLPVICVEKKEGLCDAGRREAALAGVSLDFVRRDVVGTGAEDLLDSATCVVALHACGHLNAALMTGGVRKRVPFMAIAPCCYQRIDWMQYLPLSRAACRYIVPLTRHQLRLPSLDETMTSENRRAARRREHAFRLGLDLLHRRRTGKDEYLPLGPVKPAWLKGDFAHFVSTVAVEKNVPLPGRIDWALAEKAGWDRFHLASALGLARGMFRRAIESWLILDRALFLEENGYQVSVGTFCSEDLTPRNLMILASRN